MADKKISALTAASTPLADTEVLPIVQSGATVKVAVSDLTAGRAVSASQLSSTTKVSGKIATSGSYNRIFEVLSTGGTAIGEISYNDTNDTMRVANLSNYVNTSMTFYVNAADRMEIMPNGDIKALNGNFVVSTSGKGIDFSATAGTGTSELFADYEEGTWTPTDGSGAGLTFAAGTAGIYTKIGRVVYISASVRYPVTASAANAVISGMPFTMAASPDGAQGGMSINYSPAATVLVFKPNNGSTDIIVRGQSGGAQQTNASMSNTRYDFNGFYIV